MSVRAIEEYYEVLSKSIARDLKLEWTPEFQTLLTRLMHWFDNHNGDLSALLGYDIGAELEA